MVELRGIVCVSRRWRETEVGRRMRLPQQSTGLLHFVVRFPVTQKEETAFWLSPLVWICFTVLIEFPRGGSPASEGVHFDLGGCN